MHLLCPSVMRLLILWVNAGWRAQQVHSKCTISALLCPVSAQQVHSNALTVPVSDEIADPLGKRGLAGTASVQQVHSNARTVPVLCPYCAHNVPYCPEIAGFKCQLASNTIRQLAPKTVQSNVKISNAFSSCPGSP